MNKPRKSRPDVVEYVEVKVLLRGVAQEAEPEPEPQPEALCGASQLLAQEPWELTFAKGELAACKRARTRVKQVIRNCIVAGKGWRARRNAHGNKPPRLKRCAWQKERARLLARSVLG